MDGLIADQDRSGRFVVGNDAREAKHRRIAEKIRQRIMTRRRQRRSEEGIGRAACPFCHTTFNPHDNEPKTLPPEPPPPTPGPRKCL
jgi:hypothetical protein